MKKTKTINKIKNQPKSKLFIVRLGLAFVLLALLAVAVIKNWSEFTQALEFAKDVSPWWLLLEAVLFFCTMGLAAFVYWRLAFTKVNFRHLFILELGSACLNRLLPAGSGNIGMHAVYLTKHRHSLAQATAVVSVNNLLGILMHVTALVLVVLAYPSSIDGLLNDVGMKVSTAAWVIVGMIVLTVSIAPLRRKIVSFLKSVGRSLAYYRANPSRLVQGALGSISITLFNTFIFATALHALGVGLGPLEIFVIYSVGVLFGVAVPTPGGLGGVEAGLTVGLMAKGVDPVKALAAALVFRLATYWLPLVVGSLALLRLHHKKLI